MLSILIAAAFAAAQTPVQPPTFDYDAARPINVQPSAATDRTGVVVRQITYAQADGTRNDATMVTPAQPTAGRRPGVLFVHWYGPPNPTSNRTQFLPDAIELARLGAISLLIDTPWSDPSWFPKRNGDRDYEMSVQEVKNLRRALDVLLQQPSVDAARIAFVGHDFGAMYGALAVAADRRVSRFVFMAGTQSFSDWFLYTPTRQGAARERFIAKLAPLDPVKYLPRVAPRPILLQFANDDKFVSKEAAAALAKASGTAKTVKYYNAQHELSAEATRDRIEWLTRELKLNSSVR
jgi:dipeptidyl aminopeptidase/acylaminoacyl peptidase